MTTTNRPSWDEVKAALEGLVRSDIPGPYLLTTDVLAQIVEHLNMRDDE